MTTLAVVVETTKVQAAADRLLRLDIATIGAASVRAVNAVAKRGFDESVKRMTSRVNLTEGYVRERMDIEPANDPRKPEAVIIAFRAGGRRKGMRATNLRQYAMVQQMVPVRFPNSFADKLTKGTTKGKQAYINRHSFDGRPAVGWMNNPRKPGGKLPFILRTGDQQAGIPLGQKSAGVSVEVAKGSRKTISVAFQRRMPNGEILVMKRKGPGGPGSGKGKIEALYSLSVWQLFRKTSAEIIPLVTEDLERTVGEEIENTVKELIA